MVVIPNFFAKSSLAAPGSYGRTPEAREANFRFQLLRKHATVFVFFGLFISSLWVFRPRQYFFFGDSWGVLFQFLYRQKTILLPQNEYFIPLFKLMYLLEYRLFGGNHLPYIVVGLAIHAGVATMVYKLGRQFSLGTANSVAAACMFAFSSVHWEVTGWSFCQCLELSALLTFLAISIFISNPQNTKGLVVVGLASIAAFCCGPVAVAIAPSITVYYVLWKLEHYRLGGSQHGREITRVLATLWLPPALYGLTLLTLGSISAHARGLHKLPAMIDFTLFGVAYGLVLPSLSFLDPASMATGGIVLTFVIVWLTVAYAKLPRRDRIHFWFLITLIIVPIFAASFIRLQLGIPSAASSRYQYLPVAASVLVIGIYWRALRSQFSSPPEQYAFTAIGLFLLVGYLVFHITSLRSPVYNGSLGRGIRARQYLAAARKATSPDSVPTAGVVLAPELMLPYYVYAPGKFPLWAALQILDGNVDEFLPIHSYFGRNGVTFPDNLIRNAYLSPYDSKVAGSPKATAKSFQKMEDLARPMLRLGPGEAYVNEVATVCPKSLPPTIVTFSIGAVSQGQLTARLTFEDSTHKVLGAEESEPVAPIPSGVQLTVSGFSPENTCAISLSITNKSNSTREVWLQKPILLVHPTVLVGGQVRSQTLHPR